MIRLAEEQDFEHIMEIFAYARKFMAANGNPSQWGSTHPTEDMIREDIQKRQLYVYEQNDTLAGVFAFILGEDPTYFRIDDGCWRSGEAYGVIHRIAGNGTVPGILEKCVAFCQKRCNYLRVDTHADNKIMQHLLEKCGFERRGIIYVRDNSPRIAYDRLI